MTKRNPTTPDLFDPPAAKHKPRIGRKPVRDRIISKREFRAALALYAPPKNARPDGRSA